MANDEPATGASLINRPPLSWVKQKSPFSSGFALVRASKLFGEGGVAVVVVGGASSVEVMIGAVVLGQMLVHCG